ncbi:NB-ARC domain-containing protein [Streptomyces sp. 2333.5]|uniref:FxSxx-COOH system tetratricopeptide repeat protein n=1 Tax=unclassified Streptomyces TaxID=2593676 RepID=UPI0008949D41|nr:MULTISPECIES: FxSxx-COOH system tetratricopeptide repeat protein [unclassified Streptomyces]PJJ02040.1 NB-ARC domain-containing protein [Streptomyces sp. 2333.5]SEC92849.1 NB-ARC domain-containing protein [Streptomyces sp. 2314.4]SED78565.1 NB-ARC domain-containing protein [Streptomyces sp. 2112.2]
MTDATQQFFISYAGPDRPWAEWVGWHLEQAGHQVVLDVWDWRAGDNFVHHMDQALERADAVVALFSKSYFAPERWTDDEWTAAVARRDRVIPLALEPITTADVPPLLAAKLRKDLHGLDETTALATLREAVNGGARPTSPPPFPGTTPADDSAAVSHGTKPRLPSTTGQPDVWNVRRRNPDFSGREAEIAQLRDGLLSGQQAVVRALHGMGGVGKTQIVLEYAHRFAGQYDVVWWVDAEQDDQLPVHYTELADRLGIAKPEAGSEHNARALLQHLRTEQRWLLILDNAENREQIDPWLPEGSGHVVITSRNPDWRGIAHQTGLDVFSRADSVSYLRTQIPSITSEEADLLARDVGDLPLALAQAVGVIGSGMTIDRYLQLLTTNTARILEEGDAPGYPAPLAAAVGIATTGLESDHPEAAALLRLGAFFGPDPIPTSWLESARSRLSTIPGDPGDLMWPHAALQPLSRYGLARLDHETFQIHRLTQAVLRDHTGPEEAGKIRRDVATVLSSIDPGNLEVPDAWPAWAALASHLIAHHAVLADRPELRPILLKTALFLIRSGQPRSALSLTTSLRKVWASELGEDHPDTLSCTQYLGHATADVGDVVGALPFVEDTLVRRRRVLGDDHPDTLHSANDLAATTSRLGKYAEARAMYEDTLRRRQHILGDDHPHTLQSAHSLAATLHNLGDLDEARRMDENTLRRRRHILGDDHPDTLQSAHSHAMSLRAIDETMQARRMHEDTLRRRQHILGDDHPDTLESAHVLAITLHNLGDIEQARCMDENTLRRRRHILGDDHPDTLRSAHSLAMALNAARNHAEARRMHEDTLRRQRHILGDDHPHTLESANSLAIALNHARNHAEAHRMHEDTLRRRQRVLGDDHHDTLESAHNLAVTLHNLRRYPEAAQLLEEVRNRLRLTLGDDHTQTVTATESLAHTWTAMGKRFAAQRLLTGQRKQAKRRLDRKKKRR